MSGSLSKDAQRVHLIAGCGMLTAVAVLLQYIEVPIPVMPSFIKLDFSDMPELISMSDRVLVVAGGKITAELTGDQITEQNVLRAAIVD